MSWIQFHYRPEGGQRSYSFSISYHPIDQDTAVEIYLILLVTLEDRYPGKPIGKKHFRPQVVIQHDAAQLNCHEREAIENWMWGEIQEPCCDAWYELQEQCIADLQQRQLKNNWQAALISNRLPQV